MVEGVLFKVHRFFFQRDSQIFKTMFTLPPPSNVPGPIEGEAEENPIVLQGFKILDFERFLSILYPINFLETDLSTVDEWTSVLIISTMWEFDSLRKLCVEKLHQVTLATDRVVLGKRFDLTHWLTPAYYHLCTRAEPLNLEEGEKLGIADVVKIGQIRHQIRYVTNLNRHEDTIKSLIKDAFASG